MHWFNDKSNKYKINDASSDLEALREAFDALDIDKDGLITRKDIKDLFGLLNYSLDDDEINRILSNVNISRNRGINFDDFVTVMFDNLIDQKHMDECLHEAFDLFDIDNDGYISFVDLKGVMEKLNYVFSDDDINEMIKGADLDSDSMINYTEFVYMVLNK